MVELTEELKLELVTRIARFQSYATAAAELSAEHGVEIDRFQVRAYDPTRCGFSAGDKWRSLFEAGRQSYLKDILAIPIAHQGYRLNLLQEGVDAAREVGDWRLMKDLLKLAAKEMGGALTNEHVISGRPRAKSMTSDERKEALFGIFDEALAQRLGPDTDNETVQ